MNTTLYRQASIESIRTILSSEQSVRLMVRGSSMEPVLKPGDAIVIQSIQTVRFQRGDILAVARAGDIVTHRLIRISGGHLILKGDRSPWLDDPVSVYDVLGIVVEYERNGTRIEMTGNYWNWVNGFLGWIGDIESRLALLITRKRGLNKDSKNISFVIALRKAIQSWIISLGSRLWKR